MGKVIDINTGKSAFDVVMHSAKRRKRGRNSSSVYCGVRNPKWALLYAIYSFKFGTDGQNPPVKDLCFALFEEKEEVKVPKYALTEDSKNYPQLLEKMLNESLYQNKHKFAAVLCPTNTLVIAQGDEIEHVLSEAKRKGVENPALVYLLPSK